MILAANLGTAGLLDVGWRPYRLDAALAARSTVGVVDLGDGWYQADAGQLPAGATHVRWNSAGAPEAVAREFIAGRLQTEQLLRRVAA